MCIWSCSVFFYEQNRHLAVVKLSVIASVGPLRSSSPHSPHSKSTTCKSLFPRLDYPNAYLTNPSPAQPQNMPSHPNPDSELCPPLTLPPTPSLVPIPSHLLPPPPSPSLVPSYLLPVPLRRSSAGAPQVNRARPESFSQAKLGQAAVTPASQILTQSLFANSPGARSGLLGLAPAWLLPVG
ncbi:hypothetical protein BU26DRAFT_54420 [Trematosphaeria pertusa]|uniref:Uncharacterized protein n=1 Tax=Trematosphaeria pertusa TaxID=390896 RepID=A0A6A6I932_9PLEO|nr:uncharacterized protein BU26DRAFT_54420 [Trematosphaeria pertusa]KAF2246871.1 hypothetical protein BU26DRAFT_54420 [Trematosphaeria pertusa]